MATRIHICNNDADADFVENTIRADPKTANVNITRMTDPELTVNDHTADRAHPKLVNRAKVCLYFED